MKHLVAVLATVGGLGQVAMAAPATEYFVSPQGNDLWSGTLPQANAAGTDGPFRTVGKAAVVAQPGDTCSLRAGVYRETLTPANSGTSEAPITFRNWNGEAALLSGLEPVTDWRSEGNGLYSAAMPWTVEHQNQVFVDGVMMTEARWPNNTGTLLQPVRATVAAGTVNTITDPSLPGADGAWTGAWLWCAGGASWHCWARKVTAFDAAAKALTFEPAFKPQDDWYIPRKGNEYVLMGTRNALDAEGEWWFDPTERRLYLMPPGGKDPNALLVEAKHRATAIDLRGRSHLRLIGLRFRAGGVMTDDKSADLLLQGLSGEYTGHSYVQDVSGTGSVAVNGRRIDVVGCEFAYSSTTLLRLDGAENRVVNCYVHDGDYAGGWSGTVVLRGRRHVVSRNTFRHSGRDLVSTGGLGESMVEYNDLSHAGWLTHDLGMTYGHTTDFMNTVFRYNLVHDNVAAACSMGIYFDHLSMNVIVHHNVVWGTRNDPIRFNNPSFFCLAFHNSAWHAGDTGTFDHSRRNDLFGSRFYNNLLNGKMRLPAQVAVTGNLLADDPGYVDPAAGHFELTPGSRAIDAGMPIAGINDGWAGAAPDAGAIEFGTPMRQVGHDFDHSPAVPRWTRAEVPYMNTILNSCFEYGLEGWTPTGAGKARTVPGNGWGNGWGKGEPEPTGTCNAELELGPGVDGVEQTISGLSPDTCYTLSGWVKVMGAGETVALGVRGFGGAEPELLRESDRTVWTRLTLDFRTGPQRATATVFVRKTSAGPGAVRGDNLGLPRMPPASDWERPRAEEAPKPAVLLPVPPPFTVRKVPQPPTVDGRLAAGEWPSAAMPMAQSPSRGPLGSPPCTAWLCHDGQTLYVAVRVPVTDVKALKRGREWRLDDGVEICFVDPKGALPAFSFVVHGFCGGATASVTDGKATPQAAARLGDAVRYASTTEGAAWVGEWVIPLGAADIAPAPGLRLAFNLCAYRSERNEWVLWAGTMGAAWQLDNAGTIVFE